MNRISLLCLLCLCINTAVISQDTIHADSLRESPAPVDLKDSLEIQRKEFLRQHLYPQAIVPTIRLIEQSLEEEDGNLAHFYRFQLAKLYFYIGWYSNALDNLEYCQVYYRQNLNTIEYVRTCHMLSLVNYRLRNAEMANYFFGQTELEKPTINNPLLRYEHMMLGVMLRKSTNDSLNKANLTTVLRFAQENEQPELIWHSYDVLGDIYASEQAHVQACLAYLKALNICDKGEYLYERSLLNMKIYNCLSAQEQYKEANERLLQFINIRDTLAMINRDESITRSVDKYEDRSFREGKIELAQDKRMFELKSRRSNFTLVGLLFGIGTILLAAFLIVLFYQQKLSASEIILKQNEQINHQRIRELEQSMALRNLESMIKGQEKERERIAKDLHDSLGGLLSAIKLKYDTLIYQNGEAGPRTEIQKVHDLIDEACGEIRSISHDLKPGALEKLGLIDAVEDMINRFEKSGQEIIFQYYGLNKDDLLDSEIAVYVYRIIQELVNNSSKHAEAHEILVQLTRVEDQLEIIVEDDGIGFDESSTQKGMGLDNIRSRVYYLKGEISVRTDPGGGTSTYIVIPLTTVPMTS
ncbi:MAG: sensor histidine kinase [Saprospiraceae bacterium]|nr:sensor histidine kinase [Saprospiraceae bacterium]HMW38351.1 sensor histidine kinase [Saprospiraceae bacterium]HMX87894.1 sensor histidine kinase [Saprospiraceae bacterium]HMZ39742.1 sensor histidine kinase [Saprospiraceae bacterium]HNA63386.1 sensor histidine kinase [Saprospiraceae bacterium]